MYKKDKLLLCKKYQNNKNIIKLKWGFMCIDLVSSIFVLYIPNKFLKKVYDYYSFYNSFLSLNSI